MDKETVDFYNKESAYYSRKRYDGPTEGYIQYVFRRRLALFLSYVQKIEKDLPKEASILEIGCADGVVFKALEERFPNRFSKLVGIDVSPSMIDEALKTNNNPRTTFEVRGGKDLGKFDIVIELGVHPYDLDAELTYVRNHMNTDGYFFYDVSGSQSIYRRIKLKDADYADDYRTYQAYKNIFNKYLSIKAEIAFGFFIPKLWKIPAVARIIQPLADTVFMHIMPELFQEKLFVFKK